jgi:hypothetical protein
VAVVLLLVTMLLLLQQGCCRSYSSMEMKGRVVVVSKTICFRPRA